MITVPAMWSDAANAKSSPVQRKQVLEKLLRYGYFRNLKPQQCMSSSLKSSLFELGDVIVLRGAGRRTVDLITFLIVELEPNLAIKEEAPGSVSLCTKHISRQTF